MVQKENSGTAGKGRPSVWMILAVVLTPWLFLEIFSFLIFLIRGEVHDNLAFHPLFRSQAYQNSTFNGDRLMFDPFLGYRYRPRTKYGPLEINEHGFIHNGAPFPEPTKATPNKFRIFIFGGSTVAGSGASGNATTIAAGLEKYLNQEGSRYEVINAGVDGYFSYLELAYFLADVHRYHPDLVIFYDGWNDFAYPCWAGGYRDQFQKDYAWPNSHEYALYLLTVVPELEANGRSLVNLPVLLDRTYTTILFQRILNKIFPIASIGRSIDVRSLPSKINLSPKEAAGRYADSLTNVITTMKGRELPFIQVLQPSILDKSVRSSSEEEIITRAPLKDLTNDVSQYYTGVRETYRELSEKFDSSSTHVEDLSTSMWDAITDTVYVDSVHTNDRGNRIIASKLGALVKSSLSHQPKSG